VYSTFARRMTGMDANDLIAVCVIQVHHLSEMLERIEICRQNGCEVVIRKRTRMAGDGILHTLFLSLYWLVKRHETPVQQRRVSFLAILMFG
jgi:enolase